MIALDKLSKIFPGQSTPAVDALSLEVPSGETCVFIGPSGCGKTTTMRMINRLIEPSNGRIVLEGEDVTRMDAVVLRRRIGYVIQQVGLFPHQTIAENIATVPHLLGWKRPRIEERIDEMLTLVGLAPALFRKRYPRELSGGQRQRVGVARALAADPPVMLMDEPFGAIDPITRTNLQNEFVRILRTLGKTVIFVTHDIDEAIKMGDKVAILKDGRLVQFGSPDAILSQPINEFVAEFVGADRALKRLNLITVRDAMRADVQTDIIADTRRKIGPDVMLRDALAQMLSLGVQDLAVFDGEERLIGHLSLSAIQDRLRPKP